MFRVRLKIWIILFLIVLISLCPICLSNYPDYEHIELNTPYPGFVEWNETVSHRIYYEEYTINPSFTSLDINVTPIDSNADIKIEYWTSGHKERKQSVDKRNDSKPENMQVQMISTGEHFIDVYIKWIRHDYYHVGEEATLQTYIGVGNGTYSSIPPYENNWIWGNTTYTWSINVTDGITWTNETYEYTTGGSRYDVSNNDLVNFQDAGLVWVHRTSEVPYDGLYDVNQDGQVNFQDAGLTWVNRD